MKKVVIIGLVCIVLGIALAGAGFTLSGGDVSAANVDNGLLRLSLGNGGDREPRTYTFRPDGVRTVHIDTINDHVELGLSPDGDIHVTCYENSSRRYEFHEGLTLSITQFSGLPLFNFGWGGHDYTTTVLLPAAPVSHVSVNTVSGSVRFPQAMTLEDVSIDTTSGSVEIAPHIDAPLNTQVVGVAIIPDTLRAQSISLQSTSGAITAEGLIADSATFETVSGAIRAERLDVKREATFESVSGSIRAELTGPQPDYAVKWDTVSGRCNLPDRTAGPVKLSFETVSGNIEAVFAAPEAK